MLKFAFLGVYGYTPYHLSRGLGFNIVPINQKLLSTVAEEVWDTIKSDAIKKVSASPEFPNSFLKVSTPYFAFHARYLFFITMPHHHAMLHHPAMLRHPATLHHPVMVYDCHTLC